MARLKVNSGALDAGCGVVDEDVQLAILILNGVEQLRYLTLVSQMGTHSQAADAERLYFVHGFGGGAVVAKVIEGDGRASSGEFERDGPTDAARAAGNQGNLSAQVGHDARLPCRHLR